MSIPLSTILHVNVTDFMAAVEEVRDPSLRGRPFVVGWQGRSRAIVLAVSETAFREGVRRGMWLAAARQKVRTLQVLAPSYDVYRRADARLAEVASRFSPVVELKGGGHLYLDLAGTQRLFGPPEDCAVKVRKEIIEATDLFPALGLASARVVSKVGTRVVRPCGFIAVPQGEERSFLAPLDVSLLPGVGARLLTRLHFLQIRTIGDLASLSEEDAGVLGPTGVWLRNRARGIDTSPLQGVRGSLTSQGEAERNSLSAGRSLPEDTNDSLLIRRALRSLIFELGFTLRTKRLAAGLLKLQVTYTDGLQAQGTRRFPAPVTSDEEMMQAAEALLPRVLQRRVRVRQLRCTLAALVPESGQLDLYLPRWDKSPFPLSSPSSRLCSWMRGRRSFLQQDSPLPVGIPYEARVQALQESLDRIRRRFGREGIRPCADLVSPCTFLS